jgi:hypothetical protein
MWRKIPAPLLVALLVLALLGLAEAVARATSEPPVTPWLRHPLLGRVRPPLLAIPKIAVDDGKPFVYETNALGMRGKSVASAKKQAGTYRVFFAGGSTSENPNTREEETFPGVAERLLNERLKGAPRVEVGNAGVSANVSAHTLSHVAHRLLALEPDLIVALEVNDFFDALRENWNPSTYELAKHEPLHWKEWLEPSCRLYALLARNGRGDGFDNRQLYLKRARDRQAHDKKDPPEEVLLRGREKLRDNLRRMAILCQARKVPLVLMTAVWLYKDPQPPEEEQVLWMTDLPGHWQGGLNLTNATARRGVDAYNEVIREVAKEKGTLLVDLDRKVPHDLVHLLDDCHFTVKGNAKAAELIVDELLKDGKLP